MTTRFASPFIAALTALAILPGVASAQIAETAPFDAPAIMIMDKEEIPSLRLTPARFGGFGSDHSDIMGTQTRIRPDQRVFGQIDPDTAITPAEETAILTEIEARFGKRAPLSRAQTGLQFKPDPSMFLHRHGEGRLAIGQDAIASRLSADF